MPIQRAKPRRLEIPALTAADIPTINTTSLPSGSILQVQKCAYVSGGTQTTINSTSTDGVEANTNLRITITPQKSDSYILVYYKVSGQAQTTWSRGNIRCYQNSAWRNLKVSSGGSSISIGTYGMNMTEDGASGFPMMMAYDFPATTSQLIYSPHIGSTVSGNNYFPHSGTTSFGIAMEIAG